MKRDEACLLAQLQANERGDHMLVVFGINADSPYEENFEIATLEEAFSRQRDLLICAWYTPDCTPDTEKEAK